MKSLNTNALMLTPKEFVLAGGIFPQEEKLSNDFIMKQALGENIELFTYIFNKEGTILNLNKNNFYFYLIKQNKIEHVKALLDSGWDIETTCTRQKTGLLAAAENESADMLEFFIKEKADILSISQEGNVFHISAKSIKALEIVEFLFCTIDNHTLDTLLKQRSIFNQTPFETFLGQFCRDYLLAGTVLDFMIDNIFSLDIGQNYKKSVNRYIKTPVHKQFAKTKELMQYKEKLDKKLTIFQEKQILENQILNPVGLETPQKFKI